MNLIEQLGGYVKAKNIRLGNEEDWMFYSTEKDWYSDIKHDESFIFIDELKYQLLQHRRENNIYETGDKVVRLDNDNPYIYTIQKVDSDCITIVRKKKSNAVKTWGMWLSHNELRHATDKEIAQGYRDK